MHIPQSEQLFDGVYTKEFNMGSLDKHLQTKSKQISNKSDITLNTALQGAGEMSPQQRGQWEHSPQHHPPSTTFSL